MNLSPVETPVNATYVLVKAALAHTENVLRDEYNRQLTLQCEKILAELAADGWDARIHFGYPDGNMSRKAYQLQVAKHNLAKAYTVSTKPTLSRQEPDIRVAKADNAERLAKKAAEMAKNALEGYCLKLASKIDEANISPVESVVYEGGVNVWAYSFITVNRVQHWKTKMIINVSCLGNAFNQWPTRLVK